jgi:hypothetical protein
MPDDFNHQGERAGALWVKTVIAYWLEKCLKRMRDAVQSDLCMYTKEPSIYYTNNLFRFLFHFMFLQSLIVVS